MDQYMVIKVCKQYYRFVVMNLTAKYSGRYCKNICITGNLPELYPRMTIYLEINKSEVSDYDFKLTDKNITILEKHEVDPKEFEKALQIHSELKSKGYNWESYKMETNQLYKSMSFKKADYFHKILVGNATDEIRINAINNCIIKMTRAKHLMEYSIGDYLEIFDKIENEAAYERLSVITKMQCVSSDKFGFYGNMIFDQELKNKEDFIRDNIKKRLDNQYPLVKSFEIQCFIYKLKSEGIYTDEQIKVLNSLVDSAPCIITGKAGTGKTSVVKLIMDCYSQFYGNDKILLIAPTGKASRRLAEKTGYPASTIHKALRKRPDDDFVLFNQFNPLPYNLIIVDESSMIDTLLMYDLLNAIPSESKVIFVGDHNQLPPVGYGEPFFDFLNILPVSLLSVNHRQADDTEILNVANEVLAGYGIRPAKGVTVNYVQPESMRAIIERIKRLDEESYQIISPYNELNYHINSMMKKGDKPFNVGDKIIMTRNTEEYCNGDIGYIKSISFKKSETEFSGFTFNMQLQIENRIVTITEKEKNDIMLAYAITVHKMQGSESERIIIISPNSKGCLSNTRLMYTAITRAKKELNFIIYDASRPIQQQ